MYRNEIVKELMCLGKVCLKEDIGSSSREAGVMKSLQTEGLVSENVIEVFKGLNYSIRMYVRKEEVSISEGGLIK